MISRISSRASSTKSSSSLTDGRFSFPEPSEENSLDSCDQRTGAPRERSAATVFPTVKSRQVRAGFRCWQVQPPIRAPQPGEWMESARAGKRVRCRFGLTTRGISERQSTALSKSSIMVRSMSTKDGETLTSTGSRTGWGQLPQLLESPTRSRHAPPLVKIRSSLNAQARTSFSCS